MKSSLRALNAVSFFMADVAGGLGPFLDIYLQARHWSPAEIGLVMTVGGLAGMVATAPLGALVDQFKAKRTLVVIAGAAIGPALAGITLGLVGQKQYTHWVGRTQAFNYAGNVTAAVLAGALGYVFGIGAVFTVLAVMAAASAIAIAWIDPKRCKGSARR